MLESLIKLSKELLEMELVKESLEIDSLIHKLYGVGGTAQHSFDEVSYYEEEYSESESSSEDLKSIISNSSNEEFREGISEILIESLSIHELELIKEAITDYLE